MTLDGGDCRKARISFPERQRETLASGRTTMPHAPRTQRKSKARSQGQSAAKRSANRQGEGIHAQGRGVDFVAGTRAMIRYVDAPRELSNGAMDAPANTGMCCLFGDYAVEIGRLAGA